MSRMRFRINNHCALHFFMKKVDAVQTKSKHLKDMGCRIFKEILFSKPKEPFPTSTSSGESLIMIVFEGGAY